MTDRKNLNKSTFSFRSRTYVKEMKLSKYKVNKTEKYINLLGNKPNETNIFDTLRKSKTSKPITHLVKTVFVFSLERSINFHKNHIPEEIIHDLVLTEDQEYDMLNNDFKNCEFFNNYLKSHFSYFTKYEMCGKYLGHESIERFSSNNLSLIMTQVKSVLIFLIIFSISISISFNNFFLS